MTKTKPIKLRDNQFQTKNRPKTENIAIIEFLSQLKLGLL